MSGRFRRRSYGRSRYSRYRRSGFGRSGLVRRARGNLKAANQQNDTSDVVINLIKSIYVGCDGYCKVGKPVGKDPPPDNPPAENPPVENPDAPNDPPANDGDGDTPMDTGEYTISVEDLENLISCGVVPLNIYDLLRASTFYSSYANMYDQFRITSIKVKLTPVSWQAHNQSGVGNPNSDIDNGFIYPQAFTVVTAWDRTGLDRVQYENIEGVNLSDGDGTNSKIVSGTQAADILPVYNNETSATQAYENLDNLYGNYYCSIGDNITSYSSAKTQQLVAGATFNCTRYLYPSSQQEKGFYVSTSEIKDVQYVNEKDYASEPSDKYDELKPNNLYANPNCPFKPTFLVGILGHNDVIFDSKEKIMTNIIKPIKFNCEFDIGVTFRGLRKAQVV